jgi:N6-adenosine-specific RNA methylase IME4
MNQYKIIYADPPWEYRKSGGIKSARGLAKKFYPTMFLEDIKNLPISLITNHNCYLFLWVTAPCIQEGLDVLRAWGFDLFTIAFTWIKMNTKSDSLFWGMGNATRVNPEYVLLGRKGKLERKAKNIHSVVVSKIGKHSEKPIEIRQRIELLYGDLPRIELFARQKTEGWDCIGNDINGKDIRQELKEMINGQTT